MNEEIIRADEQGRKEQGQDATSPVAVRTGLPRALASYSELYSDKASGSKGQRGSKEGRWTAIA